MQDVLLVYLCQKLMVYYYSPGIISTFYRVHMNLTVNGSVEDIAEAILLWVSRNTPISQHPPPHP